MKKQMDGMWLRLGITAAGAVAAIGIVANEAEAATIFSTGAGSAVTTVDRSANFDSIRSNDPISNYVENGLELKEPSGFSLTAGLDSLYFGGSNAVSISTTDGALMTGLEFLLSSFPTSSGYSGIQWQTYRQGLQISQGTESGGSIGTILGWRDIAGFDKLIINTAFQGNQASLILDNLNVQLLAASPPNPTPIPTPALLPGLIGMGLAAMRKRKQAEVEAAEA